MAHRGQRVLETAESEGEILFNSLEEGVQSDVAACIRDTVPGIEDKYRIDHGKIWGILNLVNPPFPLMNVDPQLLAACEQREVYYRRVDEYTDVWLKSPLDNAGFPPVVINTSEDKYVLCEGGHRSCSAAIAGVPEILAVDIAEFDTELLFTVKHPDDPRMYDPRESLEGRKDWSPRTRGEGIRYFILKTRWRAGDETGVITSSARGYYPEQAAAAALKQLKAYHGWDEAQVVDIKPWEGPSRVRRRRRLAGRKDWDPTLPPVPWDGSDLEQFLGAYMEAALWSSTDETDDDAEFLDENYDFEDFTPATRSLMRQDAARFLTENWEDIKEDLVRAGHDFWLTRNGHGAGFWDGDWPEAGDRLTEASKQFGGLTLYAHGGKVDHYYG